MRIFLLILTLFYLFFGVRPVFAVTVTISNVPQEITNQPFSLDVSITGASAATNYLRADFFQPNETSYFGYTYNGTTFYNGSDYSQYFPVTVTSSGYSGTIQAKIDIASSKFIGSGTYNLRIRRYTQSGNYNTNESNIVTVNVNYASPSPSATSAPSPSITPSSAPSTTTSSFAITNIPSQINSDQSFNVSVNITLPNNKNTDYYLSGAFKISDGTRYLGLTKKDSTWLKYESSTHSNQYKITTDNSGNWIGTLEVKPDTTDSDYKGSGDYIFKVSKYTVNGSQTWSNEATIKINDVSLPSPSRSPTPIPASKASPSGSSSLTTSKFSTPKPTSLLKLSAQTASVAGATASATSSAKPEIAVQVKSQRQTSLFIWVGLIFILIGISLVGYIYLRKNAKIHL